MTSCVFIMLCHAWWLVHFPKHQLYLWMIGHARPSPCSAIWTLCSNGDEMLFHVYKPGVCSIPIVYSMLQQRKLARVAGAMAQIQASIYTNAWSHWKTMGCPPYHWWRYYGLGRVTLLQPRGNLNVPSLLLSIWLFLCPPFSLLSQGCPWRSSNP